MGLAPRAFWIFCLSSRLTLLVSEINVFGQPVTRQQPLTFTAGWLSGDVDADHLPGTTGFRLGMGRRRLNG